MEQDQTNRKEMYDSVNQFMDAYPEKWSSIPKVGEFKNELTDLIARIETAAADQQKAQVYLTKSKTQLKATVARKADILNDSLEAMALVNGNDELAARMSDSYSALNRLRNLDFITRVREIIQNADEHADELTTTYGVAITLVDSLKTDSDQFAEMNGQPRAYKIASIQATSELKNLFTEVNQLLTKGLDKVMTIFKHSDPSFYKGYLAAREVINN